jgi:carboxymethylenebutenolidase
LNYVDATKIHMPMQGHFAIDDAFFPIAQADALDEKLTAAHVPHEFHRYNAQHAFANETAVDMPIPIKYDATAADTAWQRAMAFFTKHLS